MKELVGIILLTVLVVFGSCNSNTNVSLVGTSPQLFDVCQVSTGNPDYRNKELFINELKRKCKYPIEFQKNNLEAYVAIEYKTDQQGYIVKKRVVICDNKKFKKITMEIFNQVKTLKIATTEKISGNILDVWLPFQQQALALPTFCWPPSPNTPEKMLFR